MTRPMSGGRTSARRRIVGQTAATHADMSRTATVRRDNKGARTRSAIKPRRAGVAHAQWTTEAVRSRRRSRSFRRASANASISATPPTAKAPSTYRYTGRRPETGGMAGAIEGQGAGSARWLHADCPRGRLRCRGAGSSGPGAPEARGRALVGFLERVVETPDTLEAGREGDVGERQVCIAA